MHEIVSNPVIEEYFWSVVPLGEVILIDVVSGTVRKRIQETGLDVKERSS